MRYSRNNLGLVIAFCSLLITGASCAAVSPIYVSTSGSDSSGKGTISSPYRTIRKGFAMVQPGGTLYLRGGNYDEPGFTWTPKNGPSNAERTVIASYPGERAVFRPTDPTTHGIATLDSADGPRNVTWDGWTIDFGLKDIAASVVNGSQYRPAWFKFYFATNITFTNMHFVNNTNASGSQIYPTGSKPDRGPGGNILVTSCLFSNTTRAPVNGEAIGMVPHSIYWNSLRNVVIENSRFLAGPEAAYAIQFYNSDSAKKYSATNLVVRNNYIAGYSSAMYLEAADSFVYNNVIVDMSGMGIGQGTRRTLYANNTLYTTVGGASSYGIFAAGWGDSFVNNIVWGNWSSGIMTEASRTSFWTNNIALSANLTRGTVSESANLIGPQYDPGFINPPYDMGLGENSAAAGAGMNLHSLFNYDHLGRIRPAAGPWDLGALLVPVQSSQAPSAPRAFTGYPQ